MLPSIYELSAGVFVRGLSNLKAQLSKAEAHAGSNVRALLESRLASDAAAGSPRDLHRYTLAAHAHWAAEGARLAVGRLLGAPVPPAESEAKTLAELHQRLDSTIAYLLELDAAALEAGLERTIEVSHPRGATRASGSRFLFAFAIPHFYVHLTAAYAILRNQGVPLTMGDFLGDWGAE